MAFADSAGVLEFAADATCNMNSVGDILDVRTAAFYEQLRSNN